MSEVQGRPIDDCPECGADVRQVVMPSVWQGCTAVPCGHRVQVTMHHDRVALVKAKVWA